jgi:hypothetical protein
MQYDIIRRINRKFEALRRLAQLLEELGDLSTLIPNISSLIPIPNIDLSTYNQLAAACPFLNLPAPGEASLNALRSRVMGAYANLMQDVLSHPWMRMGRVQAELSKFQNKINFVMGMGASYLECLQAACNAVSAVGSAFEKVTHADIQKEVSTFTSNYLANAGQVLTAPMQTKYNEAVRVKTSLKEFGTDFSDDYTTAKAALAPAPVTPAAIPAPVQHYPSPPFV